MTKEQLNDPQYRMWNVDLYKLVAMYNRLKLDQRTIDTLKLGTEVYYDLPAKSLTRKLGVRHIEAYVAGFIDLLKKEGADQKDIQYALRGDEKGTGGLKFVVTVNRQILSDVQQDFLSHKRRYANRNFFGLNPENVVLVLNDFDYGYTIEAGKFIKSAKR